ncbi:MAG: ECF transporter S component [Firmicutes bacterium]|nr:ECF transporter S component [Bacillota bacterium]
MQLKADWGLITTGAAVVLIILMVYRVEKKSSFNSRQIALVGALTALSAAGRAATGVGMLFLQPTMFLPLIVGYAMGARVGVFVGAMTPLISNFFMGQGPWTPFQMLAWGLIGCSGAMFRYILPGARPLYFSIISFAWGYLYGAIMDIWQWSAFMHPLTLQGYIVLWIAGFGFDSMRALGNLFFCGALGAQALKVLNYYQKKLHVEYIESLDSPASSDSRQ